MDRDGTDFIPYIPDGRGGPATQDSMAKSAWTPPPPVNWCANYPRGPGSVYHPPGTLKPSEMRDETLKFDRDTVVPLCYGQKKIPSIAIPVGVVDDKLYVCYIFCEGEIEGYETFYIDDEEVTEYTGLYGLSTYNGSLTQTYDTDLNLANSDWVDPLAGTAYVAAWFKADEKFSGIPKLSAVIKGKLVYDHRNDATAYSNNPVLCLLDLKRSSRYGGQVSSDKIDWDKADTAANDCDVLIDSEASYSLNYYIPNPTTIPSIEEYILNHCNGDMVYSEGLYKINIHKSRSAVASFTQDEVWNVTLGRPQRREVFNQVRASYTITDTWQEDEYTLESDELTSGDELLASASFDFTGCASLSQVNRLSVFQLNRNRSDLSLKFKTYNTKGLERLDRFSFTHDILGLSAVDFYVSSVDGDQVTAIEYTEDLFSTDVVSDPVLPEADLPSPLDLPEPASHLSLYENVSQARDTHFTSVVNASWDASPSNWVHHYEVWSYEGSGGTYVLYGTTEETTVDIWTTGKETTLYVKVIAVNKFNKKSSAIEESTPVVGKPALPTWPAGASIKGTEAGDVAVLDWTAATDPDTVRYEIRRGRTSYTWDQSSWLATVDALNYFDRVAPAGTWRYFVKAIDSVGQYTENALSVDVEVTINPNLAFNKDQATELTGSTVNQVAISPSSTEHDEAFPITSAAHTWADRFTAGTAWSDELTTGLSWIEPVPTTGTIDLVSAVTDMGGQFSGEFTLYYTATQHGTGSPTLTPKLLLSDDGVTYTEYDASSSFTATARYVKSKFEWTCDATDSFYVVSEPVYVNIKAIPVIDSGDVTVGTSGSYSVSFNQTFAAVNRILLTPKGSTAIIALADNESLTGFDIKLFDTSGAAAAGDVYWKAEGI